MNDVFHVYGMSVACETVQLLKKAGKNPTRAAVMAQTRKLRDASNPFLLPGIAIKTTATERFPIEQSLLQRWSKELAALRRPLGLSRGLSRRAEGRRDAGLAVSGRRDGGPARARRSTTCSRRRAAAARAALVTYSPKVFIPLTTLCRDVCGYCTFARPPRRGERAFLTEDEVLAIARAGAAAGCTEALFTLGDKPELRYSVARDELAALGCATTLEYLGRAREARARGDRLLPHLNPGVMSRAELARAAARLGVDGDHARDDRRAARGERRPALGLARQGAGAPARDDRARRRAARPVHERDPDRDRRDARRAARRARRAARRCTSGTATCRR